MQFLSLINGVTILYVSITSFSRFILISSYCVLNSKAQITEQDVAISDWDSIDTIGIYSGNSENGTKNAPVDHEWVTGIALRANGNSYFMNIIAIGQTNGQIYTRTMINNAWKDWETK